jgi:HAD superfamily hydrolase (TIGR01509 family)
MSAHCLGIPNPLLAIIFDKDGLIFDVEPIEQAAAMRACLEVGHSMSERWYRSLVGSPRDANDRKILSRFGNDFPLDEYHRRRNALFDDLVRGGVPLKQGARELIQRLPSLGIRVAVATSSSRERAERELRESGLRQHIAIIVSRDDVARGKPDPETYRRACSGLGLSAKSCLALEDSSAGVRSAVGAGIPTILIPDIVPPTPSAARLCIRVSSSLYEVCAMLRNLTATSVDQRHEN